MKNLCRWFFVRRNRGYQMPRYCDLISYCMNDQWLISRKIIEHFPVNRCINNGFDDSQGLWSISGLVQFQVLNYSIFGFKIEKNVIWNTVFLKGLAI